MRKAIILCMSALFISGIHAQFTVSVNDKPIKAQQEIKFNDVQSLKVSFTNAKKIPEYTSGKIYLYVDIENPKGDLLNEWYVLAEGYETLADFIKPSKPVTYTVWPATGGKSDMQMTYSYNTLSALYQDAFGDVSMRTLNVSVGLIFKERLGYEKYGTSMVLLDEFKFVLDIWSKTNTLELADVGASFTYAENLSYTKFKKDKEETNLGSIGSGPSYKIYFSDYTAYLRGINITSGKSQEDALNELKTSFENSLKYTANVCNGTKILKTIPAKDDKNWKALTGFGEGQYENIAYVGLDQKNNPDFANVKIFEPVSVGGLSGYRFKGIKMSNTCTEKSALVTTVIGPADPSKRKVEGNDVLYILKHPKNPQMLIIFNAPSDSEKSNETDLNTKAALLDQFLSGVTFK